MILGFRRIWGVSPINRRRLSLRPTTVKVCFSVSIFLLLCSGAAHAQFASQLTLSVGEEYNDNIFFTKRKKDGDFITNFTPTITLLYQRPGELNPGLRFDFSPTGQVFARNGGLNNFGDNLTLNGSYNYYYSPRLSFQLTEALQRLGDTRTVGALGQGWATSQSPVPTLPPPGGLAPSQTVGEFISNGETVANNFSIYARYLYAPNITISGGYTNQYSAYLDQGGRDLSNQINVRGTYNWQQKHNLNAGYTMNILKSRSGEDNIVHSIDIGDDFFSDTKIQLAPTLTLSFSSGISLNSGGDGPSVANNSNINLTKVWESATISVGGRKGLTNSFGVSGISDTTTLFTTFSIRFTERFSGNAGINYSIYDTDDVDFNTLNAYTGVQYAITSWLCSAFQYNYLRRHSGAGSRTTELGTRGNIYANSAFVTISANFDLWPTLGLAKRPTSCITRIPTIGAGLTPVVPAQ
jgi:hypothetical protein